MRTVLLILACSLPLSGQDPPPLNILWIIGEDLGPDLACYGTPAVRTPNLDRLARDGMLFTRAFSPTPVCSTSRSGFMTGMNPIRIDAHNHRSHRDGGRRLPKGVRLLTHRLRDLGYVTGNLRDLGGRNDRLFRGTGKTDWNFEPDGRAFDVRRWEGLPKDGAWYAQINFSEAHRGGAWNDAHERIETPADPAAVELPPYHPDHPEVRRDQARYLNAVMALDRKVGLVLDLLERDGLADRTVVFFFGDHGRAMPRGKQWCYDSGLRVPLIVRFPARRTPTGWRSGAEDGRLVSLLDVTASTLDLAGGPKPMGMEGRVLFGPRREADRSHVFGSRDRCDETVFRIRTVRDRRFRYIRNGLSHRPFWQLNRYKESSYPTIAVMRELYRAGELTPVQATLFRPRRPAEELYDLDADPWETRNLAASPAHAAPLARLRRALDAWLAGGDAGARPEPAHVVARWEARAEKNDGERLRRRAAERRVARIVEEARVPHYELPDPLVANDGTPVADAATWRARRRGEVLELFRRHVYGRFDPKVALTARTVEEGPALGGVATRRQIRLRLGSSGPDIDVLVYQPRRAAGPVPAFLGLNFMGNQTVAADPAIHLARCWVLNKTSAGITDNRATEASRGACVRRWPVARLVGSGYALVTACCGDIDPDRDDGFKNGVHPLLGEAPDLGDRGGTIAAWAWGLSRILDWIETDDALDESRVGVVGHSRLGKTALWAGARDERFALVVSNGSGCGGAALSRRQFGERVQRINRSFPHWFCRNFRHFDDREEVLPVDQHMLVALVAPRPVLVLSAHDDAWADPRGEFLSTAHARPVYRLFGFDEPAGLVPPPTGRLVGGRVAYHRRAGAHDLLPADWDVILEVAKR